MGVWVVLSRSGAEGKLGMMDASNLRKDYRQGELRRKDLDADPVRQFSAWFAEALACPAIGEANAMTLATSDTAGMVTARTVLLKGFDADGFRFFTNLGSLKARQISQNPRVALVFPWTPMERQVCIAGSAERVSRREVEEYFARRPPESRLGAWASRQSEVIDSREALEARYEEVRRSFGEDEIPAPEFWGGFRVVPLTVEFWQGRPGRLHDRFRYTRRESQWDLERLSP